MRVTLVVATLLSLVSCDSPRFVAPHPAGAVTPVAPDANLAPPIVSPVPAGATLPIRILSAPPAAFLPREFFGIAPDVAALTASGTPSLIWFAIDGTATIWKMFGPTWSGQGATVLSIPSPWKLAATGDLNGDGNPDFIWEATTDGTRAVTFMNGPAYAGSYAMMFVFSPDWKIIGTGDFNADSKADLVVTNSVTGAHGVLFLNGTTWTGSFLFLPWFGTGYDPIVVGDLNGDSKPDVVCFNAAESVFMTYLLNGTNFLPGAYPGGGVLPIGWRIGAVADFNSDGKADLVLQNISDGQRSISFMTLDSEFPRMVLTGEYATLPTVSTANLVVSTALIRYTTAPLNLKLGNFYVTQGVQDLARSVPLEAGREAFVRVFLSANDYNTAAPVVRVRLMAADHPPFDYLVTRPGDPGVPTFFTESSLESTYNVMVAGSLISVGATISVTVDPANLIAETEETDNVLTAPLVVRTIPRFDVRFVPVRFTGGEIGDVSLSNVPMYMNTTMKVWPFIAYDADVHAVFNSSQSTVTAAEAWGVIINEIQNLRVVEGNPRYYYGVLPPQDGSPYLGMAYLGERTAIGLGMLNAGDTAKSETAAHEFGHNFNRPHSPGCGVSFPDPDYPNATGNIDAYGYNAGTVPSPTSHFDLMSYCRPRWIAGYTIKQMMNFVAPYSSPAQAAVAPTPSIVIWGRISADGTAVLEPSFQVTTIPRMPEGHGQFAIEGLDASGVILFTYAFEGLEIPDGPPGERHFSYAIPLSGLNVGKLRKLQVVRSGSHVAMGASAAQTSIDPSASAEPGESLQRIAGGVDIKWNAKAYRMVIVRDAVTGEVISFARGGAARFATKGKGQFDLIFSDGVHSRSKRVTHP